MLWVISSKVYQEEIEHILLQEGVDKERIIKLYTPKMLGDLMKLDQINHLLQL